MFLSRQDFDDAVNVLKAYQNLKTEEQVKILLANDIAKNMFPEFDSMKTEEKADIINMLVEDMSIDFYALN